MATESFRIREEYEVAVATIKNAMVAWRISSRKRRIPAPISSLQKERRVGDGGQDER